MIVKGLDLSHYTNVGRGGEREIMEQREREKHIDITGPDIPFSLVT